MNSKIPALQMFGATLQHMDKLYENKLQTCSLVRDAISTPLSPPPLLPFGDQLMELKLGGICLSLYPN